MTARPIPEQARLWLLGLDAERRDDLLGRLWDLVEDGSDMVAVVAALDHRGAVRAVLDARAEERGPPPPPDRHPTLRERGIEVLVPAETARHWRELGGIGSLGEALLDAYETGQVLDEPGRVALRRRGSPLGDLTAIAVRQESGALLVIQVTRRRYR